MALPQLPIVDPGPSAETPTLTGRFGRPLSSGGGTPTWADGPGVASDDDGTLVGNVGGGGVPGYQDGTGR